MIKKVIRPKYMYYYMDDEWMDEKMHSFEQTETPVVKIKTHNGREYNFNNFDILCIRSTCIDSNTTAYSTGSHFQNSIRGQIVSAISIQDGIVVTTLALSTILDPMLGGVIGNRFGIIKIEK